MAFQQLGRMFVSLSVEDQEFRRRLRENEREVARSARSMTGSLGMLRQAFATMAGVLGANLIASGLNRIKSSLSGMVQQGIAANAQFEGMSISMTQLVGDQRRAQKLIEEMRVYAERTPFEMPQLMAGATSLLATQQYAAEDIIPTLEKIGSAAAASSEGLASFPRVMRAVSQMINKGKLQAEEMLQLAEAGVPAWGILAEAMGKSTAEVQEIGKKGKLGITEVNLLIEGFGKRFGGLMEKQSKSWAGLTSTMRDQVASALRRITEPLYKLAKLRLSNLVDWMNSPAAEKFIQTMIKGMERVVAAIQSATNYAAEMYAKMLPYLRQAADVASVLTNDWAKAWDVVKGYALAVWEAVYQRARLFITVQIPAFVSAIAKQLPSLLFANMKSQVSILGQFLKSGVTVLQELSNFFKVEMLYAFADVFTYIGNNFNTIIESLHKGLIGIAEAFTKAFKSGLIEAVVDSPFADVFASLLPGGKSAISAGRAALDKLRGSKDDEKWFKVFNEEMWKPKEERTNPFKPIDTFKEEIAASMNAAKAESLAQIDRMIEAMGKAFAATPGYGATAAEKAAWDAAKAAYEDAKAARDSARAERSFFDKLQDWKGAVSGWWEKATSFFTGKGGKSGLAGATAAAAKKSGISISTPEEIYAKITRGAGDAQLSESKKHTELLGRIADGLGVGGIGSVGGALGAAGRAGLLGPIGSAASAIGGLYSAFGGGKPGEGTGGGVFSGIGSAITSTIDAYSKGPGEGKTWKDKEGKDIDKKTEENTKKTAENIGKMVDKLSGWYLSFGGSE